MQEIVSSVFAILCLFLISTEAQVLNPPDTACPFTYVGTAGAINWPTICGGTYPSCAGDSQSPIDIIPHWAINNTQLGPIKTNYTDSSALMTWDGYSFKIYPNKTSTTFGTLTSIPDLSYLVPNASSYSFSYAMLHAVSEHTVYGIPYDVELNLFHEAKNGSSTSIIVLCYFYTIGAPSNLLSGVINGLSGINNMTVSMTMPFTRNVMMSWGTVLNTNTNSSLNNASYWHYNGSQTSPPCTKDYRHFIFADARSLSQAQFNSLFKVLNNNWRPLQRQNNRPVWFYDAANKAHSSASTLKSVVWEIISYFY